jgi:hypothetical protein
MVIFHSYVSLPEGKIRISWRLQGHILTPPSSGKHPMSTCQLGDHDDFKIWRSWLVTTKFQDWFNLNGARTTNQTTTYTVYICVYSMCIFIYIYIGKTQWNIHFSTLTTMNFNCLPGNLRPLPYIYIYIIYIYTHVFKVIVSPTASDSPMLR